MFVLESKIFCEEQISLKLVEIYFKCFAVFVKEPTLDSYLAVFSTVFIFWIRNLIFLFWNMIELRGFLISWETVAFISSLKDTSALTWS